MIDNEAFKRFRQRVEAEFHHIPGNRAYAMRESAWEALTSLFIARWEARQEGADLIGTLRDLLKETVAFVPELVQQGAATAPPAPQQWVCPVTAQSPRN